MIALRFPAEFAVGEVWWTDAGEPDGVGHVLAIGLVEIPDGTAVTLSVNAVAEVSIYGPGQARGLFIAQNQPLPAGAGVHPAATDRRRRVRFVRPWPHRDRRRVTWHQAMPDRALRNTGSIWGGPGGRGYSVRHGDDAVDLGFIRGLPAGSVHHLRLRGAIVPGSFAAVAHLAPGLRRLGVDLDGLGDDALSVLAGLQGLESLALLGGDASVEGPQRLSDQALAVVAGLPGLESLTLLDGTYTEAGLAQLGRLRQLRRLCIEREGLTPSMFRFAEAMPALTELIGLDEHPDHPWAQEEIDQIRAMLPHVSVC